MPRNFDEKSFVVLEREIAKLESEGWSLERDSGSASASGRANEYFFKKTIDATFDGKKIEIRIRANGHFFNLIPDNEEVNDFTRRDFKRHKKEKQRSTGFEGKSAAAIKHDGANADVNKEIERIGELYDIAQEILKKKNKEIQTDEAVLPSKYPGNY